VLFGFSGELAPILKGATATIPVVVVVSNDPVESGLVASLAKPGGNITGLTFIYDQLAGKAIELLKEVAPSISRVAILWNPDHADPEFRETQRGARALQIHLQSLEVRAPRDFDGAFQAAVRDRAEALIVVGSRIVGLHQQQIGEFVKSNKLILVGNPRWVTDIGGLLSYGVNGADLTRRAASYVDKIFKGAKAADLPIQQPTTFELVVNIKAAKALSLSIPQNLFARADAVIE
jgi:putative tryptophan/tyrosine transport system substrate-binding protein